MAKDQNVAGSVKTENTYKRLPSFKTPRDLNLSQFNSPLGDSRTKKVFVPNLNVQRRKQNESGGGGSEDGGGGRDGGRMERGGRRVRGAGRGKREYIQASGVFSEGLAPQLKTRSSRTSLHESSSSKLKLSAKTKDGKAGGQNVEEEELVMKELLRDDFIETDNQPDHENSPVCLPLTKLEDLQIEPLKEENIEKFEKPGPDVIAKNGIKIKSEPGIKVEDKKSITPETAPPETVASQPSTAQLIAQAHSSDFIFIQIPHSIPRLKVPEPTAQSKHSGKKPSDKDFEGEEDERNTLRSLPSGKIGTLQILRSGRVRLLLGDVKLHLEPGTQLPFRQDVMSVEVNSTEKNGKMINLGKVSSRMLLTPDWPSLLSTR